MPRTDVPRVGLVIKRAIDVVFAILLLVVLLPILAAIALMVRIKLGSPVFFVQDRPGRNATPFRVRKFRTMIDAQGPDGRSLPDRVRLTRLGNAIRSASLDELPQLVNIVAGDMSFIGPRPLLMRYLPFFTERERIRFKMRPGLTGWAQVNGRNTVGWNERLQQDVWYVEHWSLWLDLTIVVRTLGAVVMRRGFESDPESRMANLDDERRHRGDRS